MAKDPATVAKAWADAMSSVQTQNKIKAGVANPRRSQSQAAAAAVDFWQSQVASAKAKAKYIAGVQRAGDQGWQNGMTQKGLARIGSGAQAAQPKMQQFLSQWLPFVANVAQNVQAMPKATLQDRINRMVANVQQLSQFTRS